LSLEVEHPTGQEYASHLRVVAQFFELPICQHTNVMRVTKVDGRFLVHTTDATFHAKHIIWAAGEFQYPRLTGFVGSELCRHTATITSYEALEGDDFIVIGGYESGIDAAYHLADRGKRVRLFDEHCPWEEESSDPSVALSTYSHERMLRDRFVAHVELFPFSLIESVACVDNLYEIKTDEGSRFQTRVPPLLAGGFEGSHTLIADLFEQRDDGFPLLTDQDESTLVPGLFLCGPAVRHGSHVFCFIYKYRQRFAVVAKAIATSLGLPAQGLEIYRKWGMYLDDLSCCGEECVC
jgi:hypothetical protein